MIKKVLIANRGEIALRIIRACRELEIKTVAVYSEADQDSLHAKMADESVCIGPPPAHLSYINIPNIISAAEVTGVDAIHPGYGFLAENFQFAEACVSSEIIFIGPSPESIRLMGDKAEAKKLMQKNGIPVIPGTKDKVESEEEAMSFASKNEFPLIIKAAAGGGGRGMRIAQNNNELRSYFQTAQSEAHKAFGDSALYIEKYLEEPRHIEIQIIGDTKGNIIYLGERDCSIQRRHQKILEEAPSTAIDDSLRKEMGEIAVEAAKAAGYYNAGTVEFLFDKDKNYYFMEMNTRLQVEHPVTEEVTGIDIVKEQINVASGGHLKHEQKDINIKGHVIEFRINAEDPDNDFLPSIGEIDLYLPPGGPGVRIDSHLYSGYNVPQFYDSLLAKLIVWGETREECLRRAHRALDEMIIVGVKTTIPFHLNLIENAFFKKGEIYTNFIARRIYGQ